MLCNMILDVNVQLLLNYVYHSIEGTSDPDMRLIACTSLINKLNVFRIPCISSLYYMVAATNSLPECRTICVRYESVLQDLLTKPKTLTLQDAMLLCRIYEVYIMQLRELKDVKHNHSTHTDQFVDAITTITKPYSYCGLTHTRQEVCPASGTLCKKFGNRTTGQKSADLSNNP